MYITVVVAAAAWIRCLWEVLYWVLGAWDTSSFKCQLNNLLYDFCLFLHFSKFQFTHSLKCSNSYLSRLWRIIWNNEYIALSTELWLLFNKYSWWWVWWWWRWRMVFVYWRSSGNFLHPWRITSGCCYQIRKGWCQVQAASIQYKFLGFR